jgi:predicted phage tail protein
MTLTDELVQYNDGTVIVKLVINFTAPTDNFTEIFEVEVKQLTDADGNSVTDDFKLIGRGTRTKYEFLNVIDKAEYQVRVRGVNIFGVKSSTITGSRTIIGQIAPPSDVENFACNIIGKEAHLSFDPVPDLDLSHYRINFSPLTTGAEWQNSIVLVKKLSRPGTSIVVPGKTGTYLIKAVDKLGNVSINASSVVTQVTTIGEFTNLLTQNENPTFAGSKTDVVLTTIGDDDTPALVLAGNQLFDDVTGNFDSITQTLFDGGQNATVKSSGTYEFAQTVDAGAIVTTQITATLTQQVTDRARIFDFVTGDFDDQPSNFDGDANTQSSSELQIAVSDDNVTFSTFQDFTIGDYTGRFFKFRVLMQSDNNTATPIVTAVGVTLQLEAFTVSENDVVSGTGTKSITYSKAFNLLNSIAITLSVQDMASGDKYAITGKSTTGFNIAFQNSSGTGISRTFDYVAKGV